MCRSVSRVTPGFKEHGAEKAVSVSQVFMDWTRAVVVLQVLLQPCLSGTRQTRDTRTKVVL